MAKALSKVRVEISSHREALPGVLTSVLPNYRSQHTSRWWSVDSSVPFFTRTCGRKSDETTTKSIIKLVTSVNMDTFIPKHVVCYRQSVTSTTVQ